MGKVRKLSPSERRDIVRMFPQLGVTETARRIGCSKSTVQRVWASDGPPEDDAQRSGPESPGGAEPQTRAERLVELRGILRAAMNDAPPQAVAGLAREYRATMDEIERMEGGDGGDSVGRALDSIAERIAAKMPAP